MNDGGGGQDCPDGRQMLVEDVFTDVRAAELLQAVRAELEP